MYASMSAPVLELFSAILEHALCCFLANTCMLYGNPWKRSRAEPCAEHLLCAMSFKERSQERACNYNQTFILSSIIVMNPAGASQASGS